MTDPVLAKVFKASADLLEAAKAAGVTVGVAESCTGGLLGAAITAMPGSSAVFAGGYITYSNDLKHRLLGVSNYSLQKHGAVSEAVAEQMAEGARNALRVDIAVSITGVAGPGGGSDEKPVGTVCFGLATANGTTTSRELFEGHSRNRVRDHAVIHALAMLRETVREA